MLGIDCETFFSMSETGIFHPGIKQSLILLHFHNYWYSNNKVTTFFEVLQSKFGNRQWVSFKLVFSFTLKTGS